MNENTLIFINFHHVKVQDLFKSTQSFTHNFINLKIKGNILHPIVSKKLLDTNRSSDVIFDSDAQDPLLSLHIFGEYFKIVLKLTGTQNGLFNLELILLGKFMLLTREFTFNCVPLHL